MQIRFVNEVSWLPPPPSRSRRLRWIAPPVLLLLLLSAGYIAWWLYAASEFRERTLAWIEDRRADGWRMDYTDVARRGFPLKLGLRFDKPVVADICVDRPVFATMLVSVRPALDAVTPFRIGPAGDQG